MKLDSQQSKVSYAIGQDIASKMTQMPYEIDSAALVAGINDQFDGKEGQLSQEELMQVMQDFQAEMRAKQMEQMQQQQQQASGKDPEAAKAEGEAYLAENAKKEGVTVTDSGLQYEVITEGEGDQPGATDTVTVHYKGTLIDGTEFDSSYSRGQPATFQLNQVIPGWTEGVQLMKPGAKYRFVIPSDLAYGANGAGGAIGPNETLIFEVELIK